jgi:hypothetical protein
MRKLLTTLFLLALAVTSFAQTPHDKNEIYAKIDGLVVNVPYLKSLLDSLTVSVPFINQPGTFLKSGASNTFATGTTTFGGGGAATFNITSFSQLNFSTTQLSLSVNGSPGTSGQVLTSNGTTASWQNATGGVTSVSVVSANGFAGSVSNPTTTPAITLSTTITGILKGNGTAISAATPGTDYTTSSSTETFTNKTWNGAVISATYLPNAAADGSTKGAASFSATYFDASSGNITPDFTNGLASGSQSGWMSSSTFTTLSAKQDAITGAATTITTSNLTANLALISNSSGKVAVLSTVSDTELGYLDGVTSAIQTQLSNKQPLNTNLNQIAATAPTTNQGLLYNGTTWVATTFALDPTTTDEDMLIRRSGVIARLPVGSNGNVLTISGGTVQWGSGGASGSAGGDLTGTYPNPTLAIDRWKATGTTTITGIMSLTGSLTATANSQAIFNPATTFTLRSTSGDTGYGWNFTQTLVANATSQIVSAVRIAPTFNESSFTFATKNALEVVGALGSFIVDSNGRTRQSQGASFDVNTATGPNGINYATGTSNHSYTSNGTHVINFGTITSSQSKGLQIFSAFAASTGSGAYDMNYEQLTVNQVGSNGPTTIRTSRLVPTAVVGLSKFHDMISSSAVNSTNPLYGVHFHPTPGTALLYAFVAEPAESRSAFGLATPTAKVHIGAGTTAASTAPIKLTSGSLMTSAEVGAIEFLTDKAYFTITTGTARKEFTLNDAALTSGTIPVGTTNGRLTNSQAAIGTNGVLTITGSGAGNTLTFDPVSVLQAIYGTAASGTVPAFIIKPANGISGSVTGGDLSLVGGDAYSSGNNNGGNVVIAGGALNGSGLPGIVKIKGTINNDAASAGDVGEEVNSVVSTYTNYTTTATYQNITSITLTAGDWDLSAFFTYNSNAATITAASNAEFVVSTTTASASGATEGVNRSYVPQAALLGTSKFSDSIAPYRVSIASSTTYYLNTQATFTVGNPQFVGSIRARRIR